MVRRFVLTAVALQELVTENGAWCATYGRARLAARMVGPTGRQEDLKWNG
jgi:hypothetical protein